MRRRAFLRSLALLGTPGVASTIAETVSADLDRVQAGFTGRADEEADPWQAARDAFLLSPELIHLNTGSLGASPRTVVHAVTRAMEALESDPVLQMWGLQTRQADAVRDRIGSWVNAAGDEIVLTRNTTEGMNLIAEGMDLRPGDEVLTTNHEHGGGMSCWQYLAERHGVRVRCPRLPHPVTSADQLIAWVDGHLTPRTRVVGLSHVDTITGMVMPLTAVAEVVHARGALLVADGAQGPGMLPIDVKALDVDAYAANGHKWTCGPKGTGWMYVSAAAQDRIRPAMLRSGYRAYTASTGTRDVASLIGLGVAIELHETLGAERVRSRIHSLASAARRAFEALPGVRCLTPADPGMHGGLLTFGLPDHVRSGDIKSRLREQHGIVTKAAQGTYAYVPDPPEAREDYNALRISTHYYNTEDQITRCAAAVRAML